MIGREDGSARSGISADSELLIGQSESPARGGQYLVREYEQEGVKLRTNLPGKSIKVSLSNLARAWDIRKFCSSEALQFIKEILAQAFMGMSGSCKGKTSSGRAVKLATLRDAKTLITFDPMVGFQRFKKGNDSEFDGWFIKSIAKAPK